MKNRKYLLFVAVLLVNLLATAQNPVNHFGLMQSKYSDVSAYQMAVEIKLFYGVQSQSNEIYSGKGISE